MVATFDERRRYLYARLTSITGITCVKPAGAFYVFPNISACGLTSVAFAQRLLEQEKVAVVPGLPFGSDDHIRLSYACSRATIEEGMSRLDRFIKGL
jgi:aspartate aminotransferase